VQLALQVECLNWIIYQCQRKQVKPKINKTTGQNVELILLQ